MLFSEHHNRWKSIAKLKKKHSFFHLWMVTMKRPYIIGNYHPLKCYSEMLITEGRLRNEKKLLGSCCLHVYVSLIQIDEVSAILSRSGSEVKVDLKNHRYLTLATPCNTSDRQQIIRLRDWDEENNKKTFTESKLQNSQSVHLKFKKNILIVHFFTQCLRRI